MPTHAPAKPCDVATTSVPANGPTYQLLPMAEAPNVTPILPRRNTRPIGTGLAAGSGAFGQSRLTLSRRARRGPEMRGAPPPRGLGQRGRQGGREGLAVG